MNKASIAMLSGMLLAASALAGAPESIPYDAASVITLVAEGEQETSPDFEVANWQSSKATEKATSANYTALWWNPSESGWGINFNHQGDILFGTLFSYDSSRQPLWLFMSAGRLQSDGKTFSGDLYRSTGSPFYASPFPPIGPGNLTTVGTMSIAFAGADSGSLTYSVNGVTVRKEIRRQVYGFHAAECTTTTSSRATLTNYQDLWWNPSESGWGVNVTHQDDILFATLFSYDSGGKGIWFVMSAGMKQPDGSFLGDLYMTTGPEFNAEPFTPIGPSNLTKVGTMRFSFSSGVSGTLSYTVNGASVVKPITRQEFSSPLPACVTISRPVAYAGPAQSVAVGAPVTLDGRGSTSSNGEPLAYNWTLTTKPAGSNATLANGNTSTPTFLADLAGTYGASLTVSNVYGSSLPSTVTVTAENKELQLYSVNFFGVTRVSWPYSSSGSMTATILGAPAATVGSFRLKAVGGPYTITALSARDSTGRVAPQFSDLSNGQVISAGQQVDFDLISPLTGGATVNLTYSFRILETNDSFTYAVTLRTN